MDAAILFVQHFQVNVEEGALKVSKDVVGELEKRNQEALG